jgi:hypothetical protein
MKYALAIAWSPRGSPAENVITFSSDTPFAAIRAGDLLDLTHFRQDLPTLPHVCVRVMEVVHMLMPQEDDQSAEDIAVHLVWLMTEVHEQPRLPLSRPALRARRPQTTGHVRGVERDPPRP